MRAFFSGASSGEVDWVFDTCDKFVEEKTELGQLPPLKGNHSLVDVRNLPMKKLVSIAKDLRVNAVLCCGAAVLLTACGGGTADASRGQAPQLAAISYSSNPTGSSTMVAADAASAAAASTLAIADETAVATPAAADGTVAATPGAAGGTAAQGTSNFEIGGYGAPDALTASAEAVATQGAAPAVTEPVDGSSQLPPVSSGDGAGTQVAAAEEQLARSLASRGAGSAPTMDALPRNAGNDVGPYQH
jgi:hypothetical protein